MGPITSEPRARHSIGSSLLARNRRRVEEDLRASDRLRFFSPVTYQLARVVVPRLKQFARGAMLDVGCGTMPYRHYVDHQVQRYDGLDIEPRVKGVKFVSDAQQMTAVASSEYDFVLCSEVIEHVPRPERVLSEISRVLKPGGTLLLTVPFLARMHEEPYDYYRYTRYGLEFLMREAELVVEEISPTGSLFSFLGHQISTAVVCLTWHIPVLRTLAFWANATFVVMPSFALDKATGLQSKFPLGFVVRARR